MFFSLLRKLLLAGKNILKVEIVMKRREKKMGKKDSSLICFPEQLQVCDPDLSLNIRFKERIS